MCSELAPQTLLKKVGRQEPNGHGQKGLSGVITRRSSPKLDVIPLIDEASQLGTLSGRTADVAVSYIMAILSLRVTRVLKRSAKQDE
jgi:hypothetical protein